MARKLTKQQEEFVKYMVAGYSKQKAYVKAYPTAKNWSSNSINVEASRMMNKPHIKARYDELFADYTEHAREELFYDRDKLLSDFLFLKDEARESIETCGIRQANSTAYINALKNIGELLGLYPDKKLDINANISSDFEINIINGDNDGETNDKH